MSDFYAGWRCMNCGHYSREYHGGWCAQCEGLLHLLAGSAVTPERLEAWAAVNEGVATLNRAEYPDDAARMEKQAAAWRAEAAALREKAKVA